MTSNISSTAIIHPTAKIHNGVCVGDYSIIGKNVSLGQGTVVQPHAMVVKNTTIGDNCIIYPFACIGQDPQDVKFQGEDTYLKIGNNNIFREHVTISRGTGLDRQVTVIGDHNLFLTGSHCGHDCIVGNHNIFSNNVSLGGHVHVYNYVVIGGHSAIHQYVRLGSHSMVGGMVGTRRDIPPYCTVIGTYFQIKMTINIIGLKRHNVPKEVIRVIKYMYQQISQFKQQKINRQQLEEWAKDFKDNIFVKEVMDFYLTLSNRGIVKLGIVKLDKSFM